MISALINAPRSISGRHLSSLILVFFLSAASQAQTLIFQAQSEKKPVQPSSVSSITPAGANSSSAYSAPAYSAPSNVNSELLSMIEQLQEEVQSLRGIVEEQAHAISVLKKSAKSRYLDLDSRILELSKRKPSHSNALAGGGPVPSVVSNGLPKSGNASGGAAIGKTVQIVDTAAYEQKKSLDEFSTKNSSSNKIVTENEQQSYNDAYAEVKARNFELAIKKFDSFIDSYPEGRLAGNAYYWLGEVYLVLPQLEQAEQAFTIVVQAYPDHPKVADALYKLGVTLDRMQKPKQAEEYLLDVQKRFPESTASKLAKSYKINR